jgi:hypothetical protein
VVVKSVPSNSTVVGIPGKVVQSRERITMNPDHIDLDHDRMPDVVSQTIIALTERIEALEARLQAARSDDAQWVPNYYDALQIPETGKALSRTDPSAANLSG